MARGLLFLDAAAVREIFAKFFWARLVGQPLLAVLFRLPRSLRTAKSSCPTKTEERHASSNP
jgi:membrane protein required for beta-lactamase induction